MSTAVGDVSVVMMTSVEFVASTYEVEAVGDFSVVATTFVDSVAFK